MEWKIELKKFYKLLQLANFTKLQEVRFYLIKIILKNIKPIFLNLL